MVVELRGHGRNSAPPGAYDSDTLGGDVAAVVDAVTDGPVHVMTFSRGTAYALAWAVANPGRVRSLSIGDYIPEEITLPREVGRGLLDGRWRGTPVSRLHEFADSPHDIFRPDRSRYPMLVREHVDAVDAK